MDLVMEELAAEEGGVFFHPLAQHPSAGVVLTQDRHLMVMYYNWNPKRSQKAPLVAPMTFYDKTIVPLGPRRWSSVVACGNRWVAVDENTGLHWVIFKMCSVFHDIWGTEPGSFFASCISTSVAEQMICGDALNAYLTDDGTARFLFYNRETGTEHVPEGWSAGVADVEQLGYIPGKSDGKMVVYTLNRTSGAVTFYIHEANTVMSDSCERAPSWMKELHAAANKKGPVRKIISTGKRSVVIFLTRSGVVFFLHVAFLDGSSYTWTVEDEVGNDGAATDIFEVGGACLILRTSGVQIPRFAVQSVLWVPSVRFVSDDVHELEIGPVPTRINLRDRDVERLFLNISNDVRVMSFTVPGLRFSRGEKVVLVHVKDGPAMNRLVALGDDMDSDVRVALNKLRNVQDVEILESFPVDVRTSSRQMMQKALSHIILVRTSDVWYLFHIHTTDRRRYIDGAIIVKDIPALCKFAFEHLEICPRVDWRPDNSLRCDCCEV